jgi:glutathione S-transferase
MTPILYGHPFASFVWKPLIALYERHVTFTFQMVDPGHPENQARIAELSPTGQFPALIDGDTEITQSNAIIEHLDLFHGEAVPMVPNNPRD